MLKTLWKKEIAAFFAFFLMGKNGKRRSTGIVAGFALLMVYAFGAMGAMFWLISESLCAPLVAADLDWVYFAVMGLLATGFGVIGGIFTAKSKLYEAKDNDLLLSMPIPAWMLLLVRTVSLYLFTFVFEALVFIPAVAQYIVVAGAQWQTIVGGVFVTLLMPFGALAICCLLGFLLAWLTNRLPFKNLFTVIGFLAFMVVYLLLYSKVNDYLTYVIVNGEAVGATMQTALFPFAQLGRAAMGDGVAFLWFTLIFMGLFALVYWILSLTYFHIITMKKGERYAKYKEKEYKSFSPKIALLKREFLRLFKSPMYLLNASMGTFMVLLVGIMALVKRDLFGMTAESIQAMQNAEMVGLVMTVVVCFMASSNTVSASSVSLEGETLWLIRSLPIDSNAVLFGKVAVHFLMTAVPLLVCGVGACCFMGIYTYLPWVILTAVIASALFAVMGLAINLKFPNLHWTNETAAVKQSLSVMFAMFGGWGVSLLPVGGYFLFGKYLPAWGYICVCLAVYTVALTCLFLWLRKQGKEIFESLQ